MRILYGIKRRYLILLYEIRRFFINLHPNIHVGKSTVIERGAVLSTRYGGSIVIGANCYISKYAHILTCGGNIRIGDYSTVNPLAMIYGQGGLNIGKGVRIATQTAILPSNHIFSDRDNYIFQQGLSKEGITIEDDVWIGAGVKILDGVILKRGCIIGANSVVTKSTTEYGIYVGSPARKIKER